jgi:23S rRNA (cytidine1920-2'-O)/16S rRNA (cytidine1409-2'-O)-methyltransferase
MIYDMAVAKKARLDILVVERGLAETRSKALAAIMAGQISVNGIAVLKAGTAVSKESTISIQLPCPYVSRGGFKLEAALDAFAVDPSGRVCLDVGASTGGFTDCLLQRGARLIYSIDVGHGQIASKISDDPRVIVREKINARFLKPDDFFPRPSLAVIDVSFISLTQVLGPTLACLDGAGESIALIKPQFEVGPKLAPKGIVRTEEARQAAISKIREYLPSIGFCEVNLIESPIQGAKGNREFLIFLRSLLANGERA